MSANKVEVRRVTVTDIQTWDNGDWCRLAIEEETGRFWITSSYGDWSFCFAHRGERSIYRFLAECDDPDYLAGKLMGARSHVLDAEWTVAGIREDILRMRRDGELEKDEAQAEWDLVRDLHDGDLSFDMWCRDTMIEEPYLYQCSKMDPQFDSFWKRIWVPVMIPKLLELDSKGAAACVTETAKA